MGNTSTLLPHLTATHITCSSSSSWSRQTRRGFTGSPHLMVRVREPLLPPCDGKHTAFMVHVTYCWKYVKHK